MSEIRDEPAFPTGIITDGKGKIIGGSNGMSLRDYFAAKAMQGLVSTGDNHLKHLEQVARLSYEIADGMLIARAEDE